eukprot:scaffold34922_cov141-Amphora_coffeaeformis.AAC.11
MGQKWLCLLTTDGSTWIRSKGVDGGGSSGSRSSLPHLRVRRFPPLTAGRDIGVVPPASDLPFWE